MLWVSGFGGERGEGSLEGRDFRVWRGGVFVGWRSDRDDCERRVQDGADAQSSCSQSTASRGGGDAAAMRGYYSPGEDRHAGHDVHGHRDGGGRGRRCGGLVANGFRSGGSVISMPVGDFFDSIISVSRNDGPHPCWVAFLATLRVGFFLSMSGSAQSCCLGGRLCSIGGFGIILCREVVCCFGWLGWL